MVGEEVEKEEILEINKEEKEWNGIDLKEEEEILVEIDHKEV
jgi:hypothetical protein